MKADCHCEVLSIWDIYPLGCNSVEKNYIFSDFQSDELLNSVSQLSPFIIFLKYIILDVIIAYYSLTNTISQTDSKPRYNN